MILKDISEIISGHIFRNGIKISHDSGLNIIQLKNMNEFGQVNYTELEMAEDDCFKSANFLKSNDILIKAKTNKISAGVIYPGSKKLIATNHFFIVRFTRDEILPEYVSWYLKQKKAMTYFAKNAVGSIIPILNKKIIETLNVEVPDIKTQQIIVETYHLQLREFDLITRLRDKKYVLINQILLNSIKTSIGDSINV